MFTHLFYISVPFNNFMQGRHRLQVIPCASWSVAYRPRSCLDVSSCFFLLWTCSFLDGYNSGTHNGIGHCYCAINVGAPSCFTYAALLNFAILLCYHKSSGVVSHCIPCCWCSHCSALLLFPFVEEGVFDWITLCILQYVCLLQHQLLFGFQN